MTLKMFADSSKCASRRHTIVTSRSVLPFNVDVNPNPRSAGAKLDVNDADLAKPIRFLTEGNK